MVSEVLMFARYTWAKQGNLADLPMNISKNTVGAVFVLLVLLSLWTPGDYLPASTELLRYALFLGCSAFLVGISYAAGRFRIPRGSEAQVFAAFLFYVAISALWSTRELDTYIKALLIFSALITALATASLLRLDEVLRLVLVGASIFVIASVAVSILVPSIGVETSWEHAGKWRGLAGQKNGLGSVSSLVLVMSLGLSMRPRATLSARRWAFAGRVLVVCIAALGTYMSGSRGAQLSAFIGITSLGIAYVPGLVQRVLLVAALLLSVPLMNLAVSTFFVDADKIGVVGLTINTNSRTTIWEYGLRQMEGHELLGYGVNGFWTAERMEIFKAAHGWVLDNFHNGYVTIFVEGGVIGFALLILGIGFVYVLLLMAIGPLKDRALAVAFAFTNEFCISNLVENEAGRSTSLSIILFSIIAFSLRAHIVSLLPTPQPQPGINHATTRQPRLIASKHARV